ncbi:MAG: glutamine synthetase [Planctomycetota bacterium]|nr:MAG: glutamine synthetase [Planctomycetota bacterium]
MVENSPLRKFLEIPYDELEEMNLAAKRQRLERVDPEEIAESRRKYLRDERRIKAVTVCFSDLEGRFHMLDYDKKFLLRSEDNLTFDGSSIRGFSEISESDLKLRVDWPAFYWLPADVFGPGKVIVFGEVYAQDGSPYPADFRSRLRRHTEEMYRKDKTVMHVAPEIEGFVFQGIDAERRYYETGRFEFISTGGYFHSLPQAPLRNFIDHAAEAQRALGFANEKDHPEVAPSQFELNFGFSEAIITADQIQLYKLTCRQIARNLGFSASFLPKPMAGINGNGMHCNISLARNGKNLFYDAEGEHRLSKLAWDFVDRVLNNAVDICLVLNSSVNAYRRLDPNFEAPNQIKASATNRAAMIRIPLGNERTARIEFRSASPDANPYLLFYVLLRTGLEGPAPDPADSEKRSRTRFLPGNIYDAIRQFKSSKFVVDILGEETHGKYVELKQAAADRCPKELGTQVKPGEVMFHHEVTNQFLWNQF